MHECGQSQYKLIKIKFVACVCICIYLGDSVFCGKQCSAFWKEEQGDLRLELRQNTDA